MAEGIVGGNRGAGMKRLNKGATEVTERCMGQTWVCSSVCIAQPLSLPYLLSSLLIFQSSSSPVVEKPAALCL